MPIAGFALVLVVLTVTSMVASTMVLLRFSRVEGGSDRLIARLGNARWSHNYAHMIDKIRILFEDTLGRPYSMHAFGFGLVIAALYSLPLLAVDWHGAALGTDTWAFDKPAWLNDLLSDTMYELLRLPGLALCLALAGIFVRSGSLESRRMRRVGDRQVAALVEGFAIIVAAGIAAGGLLFSGTSMDALLLVCAATAILVVNGLGQFVAIGVSQEYVKSLSTFESNPLSLGVIIILGQIGLATVSMCVLAIAVPLVLNAVAQIGGNVVDLAPLVIQIAVTPWQEGPLFVAILLAPFLTPAIHITIVLLTLTTRFSSTFVLDRAAQATLQGGRGSIWVSIYLGAKAAVALVMSLLLLTAIFFILDAVAVFVLTIGGSESASNGIAHVLQCLAMLGLGQV